MSLFLIIPGFGGPNVEHKISILENNLQILKTSKLEFHIRICVYDRYYFTIIPDYLLNNTRITWIYNKGVVGEHILKHAKPILDIPKDATYIMILLDDVELQDNVKISKMLEYIEEFNLDILSPSLTHDSKFQFQYMLHIPDHYNEIFITSACEMFCYIMPYASYSNKYFPHIEKDNPWMWGMDMMLYKYFNIKVGITNNMLMKHHYKGISYESSTLPDPFVGQSYLFKKYTTSMEELSKQKAVRYIIHEI